MHHLIRRTSTHALGAVLLTLVFSYLGLRMLAGNDSLRTIRDHQAGVFVNHVSGESTAIDVPGVRPFVPFLQEVLTFDKRPVEYLMSQNVLVSANEVPRLLVRARDGSIYSFNHVAIQYAVNTARMATVLRDSGVGEGYKERLMNTFARTILREEFGRFTALEILLPDNKQTATVSAKERLAQALAPHGVDLLELSVSKPTFPEAFEKTIERRKVADQETERKRQEIEVLLAGKDQRLANAVQQKELELQRVRGELVQELEQAKRAAVRKRYEAEQYFDARTQAGEYELRQKAGLAQQRTERYTKEAEAFQAQTEALAQQGAEAVRAALVDRLPNIEFELRPYNDHQADFERERASGTVPIVQHH
jgi:hypothetical protein